MSEWVSEWQGHLLSCPGQLKIVLSIWTFWIFWHWATPSFIFVIQVLFGTFFASIILASNALKYLRPVILILIFKKTEIRAVLDRDEDEERAMEAKAEVTWFKIESKLFPKSMSKRETCRQSQILWIRIWSNAAGADHLEEGFPQERFARWGDQGGGRQVGPGGGHDLQKRQK